MKRLIPRLSLALMSLILAACQNPSVSQPVPQQPAASPQPTPVPSLRPSPAPTPSPVSPVRPAPTASPLPSATPTAVPPAPTNLPAGLRLETHRSYLDYYGQTTQLKPIFLNEKGEVLNGDFPLEWISSSPSLLSVSPQGLVKALVSNGYATITARVSGTQLSVSTLLTVAGGSGGGGGGSSPSLPGNAPPQIISLTSSASTVLGARSIVKLQAQATDADDMLTNASYSWSCSPAATCGSFSQADGTSTYWTSAATAGDQTIMLKVSDGKAETQQSLTIRVDIGTVNVIIN